MAQTAPATAQGCYKCGNKGHWSRDCTVPQDQWIPRQPGQQTGQRGAFGGAGRPGATPAGGGATPFGSAAAGNPAGGDEQIDPEGDGAQAPAGQTAAALLKEKRKRPKLTIDLLLGHKGLPDVQVNFPDAFRRQFKGRGHEASDLRRLLEMYKRWQDRIFPHGDFDAFIASLERVSGTHVLRSHMMEYRKKMLGEVQDVMNPAQLHLDEQEAEAGAGAGAAAAAAAAAAAGGAGRAAAAWEDEDEDGDGMMELVIEGEDADDHPELDDDLLAMLEEPVHAHAPAGARPARQLAAAPAAAAQGDDEDDDDDDMLELVVEGEEEEGAPAGGGDGNDDDDDDEGMMELVIEGEEEALAAMQGAPPAAAADVAPASGAELALAEDEEAELLALAAGDGQQGEPASEMMLPPGSTGGGGGGGGPAGATSAAPAGIASEGDGLLELLEMDGEEAEEEEEEGRRQAGEGDGGGGSSGAAAGVGGGEGTAAGQLVPPSLELQASPLLGAGTEEQWAEALAGAGAAAGQAQAGRAERADDVAGAVPLPEPSLELGLGTEEGQEGEDGPGFEASPLLGACTEEQGLLAGGTAGSPGSAGFVPESEPQVGSSTQEL